MLCEEGGRELNAINVGEGFKLACVLEACEGAVAFERVAQHVDALSGVRAVRSTVPVGRQSTERVVGQAAKAVHSERQRLLTQMQAYTRKVHAKFRR